MPMPSSGWSCRNGRSASMAKIYTRTGDAGDTSLFGGRRVRKDDPRIEAIGSVDELNAALGVVRMELSRSGVAPPDLDAVLARIQHRLFDLGAELAATDGKPTTSLGDSDVSELESAIDRMEAGLEPLRAFILPGGSAAASQLHFARCVCRRCERQLVELAASESLRCEVLRYVNRLSDLLFVAARAVNQANRVADVVWQQETTNSKRPNTGKERGTKRK
jgi:cob(I)alamin adenosyltransferase